MNEKEIVKNYDRLLVERKHLENLEMFSKEWDECLREIRSLEAMIFTDEDVENQEENMKEMLIKSQEENLTKEFLTYMKNNEMNLEDAADDFCADNLIEFQDERGLELMWWPELKEDGSIVCVIQEI